MGISLDALMDIQRETMQTSDALPPKVRDAVTALDKFKASIVVELPRLYHSDEYSALNIRIRKALADMNKIADDPNQLRNALNLDVEKVPFPSPLCTYPSFLFPISLLTPFYLIFPPITLF